MKPSAEIDGLREQYMDVLKETVLAVTERQHRILFDLCPSNRFENNKEILKELAKLNQHIASLCDRMRIIERQAGGVLGVPALIQGDVPNPVRLVLALLVGKMLTDATSTETRRVSTLAETCGATEPMDLLTIHNAFKKQGVLRRHLLFEYGRTVSEINDPTLTEQAFCTFLNLPDDGEMSELAQMTRHLVKRGK